MMNGATLSADDVRSIARLPLARVLNAQLVGTIAAPLSGLVRGLNALIAGVADPAAGDGRSGAGRLAASLPKRRRA